MGDNTEKPQTFGENGRDKNGRFVAGHKGISSPNPSSNKAKELKEALVAAVSPADIQNIIEKQIEKAKSGNNDSAKIILDRCLGKPTEQHEHIGDVLVRVVNYGNNTPT